jgi:hypothetical protein
MYRRKRLHLVVDGRSITKLEDSYVFGAAPRAHRDVD